MRTAAAPADGAGIAGPSLISPLAHTRRLADVLPLLHQHALDATSGARALLFEYNPRNGALLATSGFRLESLVTDPWAPDPPEAALVADAFTAGGPLLVPDAARDMPDLAARLGVPAALLVPLVRAEERVGLVAIGFGEPPQALPAGAGPAVADAFLLALELFRARQAEDLQHDLQQLMNEFSATLAATLNLSAGLEIFCGGVNQLFGADRTSVWLHDRRARELVLQASSDPAHVSRGARVAADDPLAAAAVAMRRARAEILPAAHDHTATSTVTVPLRGTRRALGTIVFEGVRVETSGELPLLDRADAIGRQLSGAVENLQLLGDVLQSRRELENTFDSIADLVAVADRRGRLVHVNEAFAGRVGSTRAAILDRPLADYVGREIQDWIADHEAAGAHAALPATREIADPVLNGTYVITLSGLMNGDRERAGSVLVARDLTPQTRLEAEREDLRQRLTQSEKLAALGQFVAGIAHELNNPLQGVLGHLELLRATAAFPKPLRKQVQTIYREADRAAKIVRNLLVFAGSRRLVRRSVSVNAILQKVVALRAAACRAAEIEVVRHYDDRLPRALSDPLLLHQALLNILMNAEQAVAAAGHGGRIEITTGAAPSAGRIRVTIRDTGAGVPAEVVPRIFEPFYTTKEVGQGTGLGLAIAYGIVQEHDGEISVANHPEGGAVFTVELPAAPQRRRERARSREPRGADA